MRSIRSIRRPDISRTAIFRALGASRDLQALNKATGAMHAAFFVSPEGEPLLVREDVGRHNALDKLIGRMARDGTDAGEGFFLLTSRCSYELVEKAVIARAPALVTISAPTSLAVARAEAARLTLISLARPDSALVFNDPFGVFARVLIGLVADRPQLGPASGRNRANRSHSPEPGRSAGVLSNAAELRQDPRDSAAHHPFRKGEAMPRPAPIPPDFEDEFDDEIEPTAEDLAPPVRGDEPSHHASTAPKQGFGPQEHEHPDRSRTMAF